VPVVAVAGRCLLEATALEEAGISAAYTLVEEASSPEESFEKPGPLLERLGARIASLELPT
jgi:glycerate kinase